MSDYFTSETTLTIRVFDKAPLKRFIFLLLNLTVPFAIEYKVESPPIRTFFPALNLLPCCRTITLPTLTFCPPNIFTPRRLETLSRPNEVLPPAFLCAMALF